MLSKVDLLFLLVENQEIVLKNQKVTMHKTGDSSGKLKNGLKNMKMEPITIIQSDGDPRPNLSIIVAKYRKQT